MSTIKVTNIQGTGETASRSATGIAAAWLNMNGSGTVAITDSLNVASIVDNATGDFSSNLTNAMNNVGYAVAASNISCLSASFAICITSAEVLNTTSKYEFHGRNTVSGSLIDTTAANTVVHGDLA